MSTQAPIRDPIPYHVQREMLERDAMTDGFERAMRSVILEVVERVANSYREEGANRERHRIADAMEEWAKGYATRGEFREFVDRLRGGEV